MAEPHDQPAAEFYRPVVADTVSPAGRTIAISASAAERQALATRFGLVAIDRLEASVRLRRIRGEFIRLTGRLIADVVQSCVVTLEPVPALVADEFEALFAPAHLVPDDEEELEISFARAAEDDIPEPMEGGVIDVGEIVAQHLSLALAPYPRAPGASFDDIIEDAGEAVPSASPAEPERPNPFAALSRLKKPS